jgi:hypothetical protein
MRPFAAAALAAVHVVSIAPCIDVIFVKVVFVIDVDITVVPIAIAPIAAGPSTQRKSGRPPRQPHAGVVPGIGIRIIGICSRSSSVNHLWVI